MMHELIDLAARTAAAMLASNTGPTHQQKHHEAAPISSGQYSTSPAVPNRRSSSGSSVPAPNATATAITDSDSLSPAHAAKAVTSSAPDTTAVTSTGRPGQTSDHHNSAAAAATAAPNTAQRTAASTTGNVEPGQALLHERVEKAARHYCCVYTGLAQRDTTAAEACSLARAIPALHG